MREYGYGLVSIISLYSFNIFNFFLFSIFKSSTTPQTPLLLADARAAINAADGDLEKARQKLQEMACNSKEIIYADGTKYYGETKDDEDDDEVVSDSERKEKKSDYPTRHGQGRCEYPSGGKYIKYIGYWENDQYHGQGLMMYADGSKFDGFWSHNQRHGKGTFTHPDDGEEMGEEYEGEWNEGKKNGLGIFTFSDGRTWTGWFQDDQALDGAGVDQDGKPANFFTLNGIEPPPPLPAATLSTLETNAETKTVKA